MIYGETKQITESNVQNKPEFDQIHPIYISLF
jgi:hypothetical protein